MIATSKFQMLERQLNHFSLSERADALSELINHVDEGEISIQPEQEAFNLHAHSFFSYNAYGFSPTALNESPHRVLYR